MCYENFQKYDSIQSHRMTMRRGGENVVLVQGFCWLRKFKKRERKRLRESEFPFQSLLPKWSSSSSSSSSVTRGLFWRDVLNVWRMMIEDTHEYSWIREEEKWENESKSWERIVWVFQSVVRSKWDEVYSCCDVFSIMRSGISSVAFSGISRLEFKVDHDDDQHDWILNPPDDHEEEEMVMLLLTECDTKISFYSPPAAAPETFRQMRVKMIEMREEAPDDEKRNSYSLSCRKIPSHLTYY